jgi:two-component system cell cycle response regulator DivK
MAYLMLLLSRNFNRNRDMIDHVKTILFVEDSEVELLAYRKAMEREGYCVHWAKDGLEAMRMLHNIIPDLVLLDLLMPKFDGVDVMKFIQAQEELKLVPIIIFSTNSIIDSDDEGLLEGAIKRLLKSQCTPQLMLKTIRDVFEGKITPKDVVKSAEKNKQGSEPGYRERNTTQRAEAALADFQEPTTAQRADAAMVD